MLPKKFRSLVMLLGAEHVWCWFSAGGARAVVGEAPAQGSECGSGVSHHDGDDQGCGLCRGERLLRFPVAVHC